MTCNACKIDGEFVGGQGNPHARVMVVGMAPRNSESMVAAPFAGKAGELLRYVLEALVGAENLWYTNLVKRCCERPTEREISICSGHMAAEAHSVRPEIILALGSRVGNHFLNAREPIQNIRGMRIPLRMWSRDQTLLITYDPGHVLRSGGIDSRVGAEWTDDLGELLG